MKALLVSVLVLAGCVPAQVEDLPLGVVMSDPEPGDPPKMGEVTGRLGDQSVSWETFDFSIGAFDASAWVEHFDGPYRFHITGYTPGDPKSEVDRLRVTGTFAGKSVPGTLRAVEVTIGEGSPWSSAQEAKLVVERIEAPEGSGYGNAKGRITATFCPSNPAILAPCRLFEARFSTTVQFNG